MAPPPIKIRIGASMDQSVSSVFDSMKKKAEQHAKDVAKANARAAKAAEKEAQRTGKAMETGVKTGKKAVDQSTKDIMKSFRMIGKTAEQQMNATARAFHRAEQQKVKDAQRAAREIERAHTRAALNQMRMARRAADEAQKQENRFGRDFARRTARDTMTGVRRMGSFGARAATDLARGMGVNVDIMSNVSAAMETDRQAILLSNAGYRMGEEGPAGVRVPPEVLKREAREIQKQIGIRGGAAEIESGMHRFVEVQGNLYGARKLAKPLLERAAAFGAKSEDVFYAAAKADSALEKVIADPDERNKEVLRFMDQIGMQGKRHSIEFKDAAKILPRLTGMVTMFGGGTVDAMTQMMGVAQMAEKGPAPNPRTAAIYAENFLREIVSRADAFKKVAGVNVFETDPVTGRQNVRMPLDILEETVRNTAGKEKEFAARGLLDGLNDDVLKQLAKKGEVVGNQFQLLHETVRNKRGNLAMAEFMNIYRTQGDEGLAKARKQIMAKADPKQIQADLATYLAGNESKVERFNAKLEEVVDKTLTELIPAMEQLAPQMIVLAEAAGDFAVWVSQNPWKTLALAFGTSLTGATIQNVFRTSIERAILGQAGGNLGTGGTGLGGRTPSKLGRVLAGGGAMLTIGTMAVTTASIGMMVIDEWFDRKSKDESKRIAGGFDRIAALDSMKEELANKSGITEEEAKGYRKQVGDIQSETNKAIVENADGQNSISRKIVDWHLIAAESALKAVGLGGVSEAITGDKDIAGTIRDRDAKEKAEQARLIEAQAEANRNLIRIANQLEKGIQVSNLPKTSEGQVDQGRN